MKVIDDGHYLVQLLNRSVGCGSTQEQRAQHQRAQTIRKLGLHVHDNCCWKLRVINRYWVSNDEYSQIAPLNEKGDHGLFFQIVLKGLGGLTGAKVESFLDKGIEGYREREDQAF